MEDKKSTSLSENEWYIMQVLWEHTPSCLREICDILSPIKGWSRHAVISFLKRMEAKGAVRVENSGKVKLYFPVWDKEDMIQEETHSILERVYGGNIFLMLSNAVRDKELSEQEKQQLLNVLENMSNE